MADAVSRPGFDTSLLGRLGLALAVAALTYVTCVVVVTFGAFVGIAAIPTMPEDQQLPVLAVIGFRLVHWMPFIISGLTVLLVGGILVRSKFALALGWLWWWTLCAFDLLPLLLSFSFWLVCLIALAPTFLAGNIPVYLRRRARRAA